MEPGEARRIAVVALTDMKRGKNPGPEPGGSLPGAVGPEEDARLPCARGTYNGPIAIVMTGKEVSAHFGRAERVMLIFVEGCDIRDREILPAPEHRYGALPSLLEERGVDILVTGSIGANALRQLEEAGVKVFTGATGSAEDVLGSLLSGALTSTGTICEGGKGTCADAGDRSRAGAMTARDHDSKRR